jgi:hypothetical protein
MQIPANHSVVLTIQANTYETVWAGHASVY